MEEVTTIVLAFSISSIFFTKKNNPIIAESIPPTIMKIFMPFKISCFDGPLFIIFFSEDSALKARAGKLSVKFVGAIKEEALDFSK